MPGGRGGGSGRGGGGRGGGFGRGRGNRSESGSGWDGGGIVNSVVDIGRDLLREAVRRNPREDRMGIQPVGEPIRVDDPAKRQPAPPIPESPVSREDLSVRAEMNILKDQVGRIGDLMEKINNRLEKLEEKLGENSDQ